MQPGGRRPALNHSAPAAALRRCGQRAKVLTLRGAAADRLRRIVLTPKTDSTTSPEFLSMQRQPFVAALAAAAALATTLPAAAQFRKPEDAVKYRQSVMAVQNFHLGRIFGMAGGRIPFDAKVVAEDAAVLDVTDKLPFVAFVDGSGPDKVPATNAKAEIWKERAKFDAAAAKMVEDVSKLNVAAKSGNIDQIKAAVGAVGQSCKACHDAYQKQ